MTSTATPRNGEIALGTASNGEPLVVVHTWEEMNATNVKVRIVSARRANGTERAAYEEAR